MKTVTLVPISKLIRHFHDHRRSTDFVVVEHPEIGQRDRTIRPSQSQMMAVLPSRKPMAVIRTQPHVTELITQLTVS